MFTTQTGQVQNMGEFAMGSGNSNNYHNTYGASQFSKNNTPGFKRAFSYNNGLFGSKSLNKDAGKDVRNIVSSSPVRTAKYFYRTLSHGGKEEIRLIKNRHGKGDMKIATMPDGTVLTYRRYSSSDGSPVVEINIKRSTHSGGVVSQKIHFIKGDL